MAVVQIYFGEIHGFTGMARYKGDELIRWSCTYRLTVGKVYQFVDGHFTDDEGTLSEGVLFADELKANGFIIEV